MTDDLKQSSPQAPERIEIFMSQSLGWQISRVGGGIAYVQESKLSAAERRIAELETEVAKLRAQINTPELHDFANGVVLEAAHQRARWGSEHDGGKTQADWYWLIGYLGGKALYSALAGDKEKALHHVITTAAACANWHAALTGDNTSMRPGIEPPVSP